MEGQIKKEKFVEVVVEMTNILLLLLICHVTADGGGFDKDWNYHANSNIGPNDWVKHYPKCNGTHQSPIDIETAKTTYDDKLKPLILQNYEKALPNVTYVLKNVESTIKLEATADGVLEKNSISILHGGVQWKFAQFHFHWGSVNTQGSEHKLDGKSYAGELHLVHYNAKYKTFSEAVDKTDGLLVWGQFIQVDGANKNQLLDRVISEVPKVKYGGSQTSVPVFPMSFMIPPDSTNKYYTYSGSLTTPTCDQSVQWIVNPKIIKINQKQMDLLRTVCANRNASDPSVMMSNNFRPPQLLNGREVRRSFSGQSSSSYVIASCASLVVALLIVNIAFY